jgi:hypothetical protein
MRPPLIVLLLLNTTSLFSQHNWGFKLGYHNSGMQFKTASPDANAISRGSFHAGVFYELAINQNLYLQPAISLYQKGASLIENGNKIDINPVYIEVPLNFLAKFEVADGRIFLGGGPYGSIGVAGSVIANTNVLGYGQGHPIKYGSDEDRHDFKRFDFGINVLTGYDLTKALAWELDIALEQLTSGHRQVVP